MTTINMHMKFEIEILSQPSVTKISLKFIFLRFHWNLPGFNELRWDLGGYHVLQPWNYVQLHGPITESGGQIYEMYKLIRCK